MANTRFVQNNFNSGELSPRLSARDDFERYKNGCRTLENFIPLPHGGVRTREGWHFVSEVKDSTKRTVLIPFEFSTEQAYMIEVGHQYFRFYRNGGRIESPPGTPVELATPYAEADLATLQYVQSADTLYIVHNNYAPRKLTRTSHTAWTLTQIDFVDGPYMAVNKISSRKIKVSANTGTGLTMTANGHGPFVANHVGSIWRIKGQTNWGYVKVTAFTDPNQVTVDVINTLDFATPGTDETQNWAEGAWSVFRGFPGVVTIFEQRLVFGRSLAEPQTVWGSTTGSYEDMSPSNITGTVADSDAITYKLGANKVNVLQWLVGGTDAVLIGTAGDETSVTGGNNPLTPTSVRARRGTTYGSSTVPGVPVGSTVAFVQRSGRKLRQLQYSFERSSYISADLSIFAEHLFRKYGIVSMAWAQDPDNVLWSARADGAFLSFTYMELEQVQGWARHNTDGQVEWVAVMPSSDLTHHQLWAVVKRSVGGVSKRYIEYLDHNLHVDSALTYDGTVTATSIQAAKLSGKDVQFTAGAALFVAGDVGKDILLLGYEDPSDTGDPKTKWYSRASIKQFVDSTHVICDIVSPFPHTSPISAGSWALAVDTVTGLTHLEGKTVQVVGDGAVYTPQVVSGGSVNLIDGPRAANIAVGLGYTCTLESLDPAYRDSNGAVKGRNKKWSTLFVALEDTVGLTIGNNVLPFRKPSDPMDRGVPVFTGEKQVNLLGWSKESRLKVTQTLPMPATVLALYGDLDVGE